MNEEEKQKPEANFGNIAVWPAKTVNGNLKVNTVTIDKFDGERQYVSVFPKIGDFELLPNEILEVCSKNRVTLEGMHDGKQFACTIVNRGIETNSNDKDGNTYKNHTMKLGLAFHKIDKEGHTFGYSCNGVGFYKNTLDKNTNKEIHLTPEDCFTLLDGKTLIKDGLIASLRPDSFSKTNTPELEDPPNYKTARLNIFSQDNFIGHSLTLDPNYLESLKTTRGSARNTVEV